MKKISLFALMLFFVSIGISFAQSDWQRFWYGDHSRGCVWLGDTRNCPPCGGSSGSSSQILNHREACDLLRSAGISWSSSGFGVESYNPTKARNNTSFEDIRRNTINAIISLKRTSGADIVITGGTEDGHESGTYSHANGYKVDLRTTSSLNNYIEQNFRRDGTVGGYPAYRCSAGNLYVRESTHWDVVIY